jgi:DMSO/TMAO reductase YedYZ molybdopterin-dependent catalytic subunit
MKTPTRRQLLRLLAAYPAVALRSQETPKRDMIARSVRPEDFEMPLDGFTEWITPVERFFVRSHMFTPKVDAGAWRLRVGGQVRNPLTLDMAALRRFPRVELVSVLECAGNGRSFYRPRIAGMQWQYGGVGNGRWAGVRLADVLKKADLRPAAREILFNGADIPVGAMPDFTRSVPLEKALHPDTLLAYEMNGRPLPVSHGFPLRLVAPGWAGDGWVKWLTGIDALDREHDGFFMKTAYRRPVRTVMPGTALDPAQMVPVTSLRPKSVIASPVEGQMLAQGRAVVRGAAWAGESPVARVDVSTDSGRTWRPAELGRDQARYGWRLWEAAWQPAEAGSYVLMARAEDGRGERQPLAQDWNQSGYLWNVVHQVRVGVGLGEPGLPPRMETKIPAFPAKVKAACLGCHGEDMVAGQRLNRAGWEREVDKMIKWGAHVPAGDRAGIIDFLLRHFGPE